MGTQLSLGVMFVPVMLTYFTRLFMLFLSNECENVCFQCRDAVNSLIRTYIRGFEIPSGLANLINVLSHIKVCSSMGNCALYF